MFDEYSDDDLEDILDRVNDWGFKFSKSEYYDNLTEEQKQESEAVIMFFTEYMYTYHGLLPEDWDDECVEECCLETLPRKITAKEPFYRSVAPVLSTFFDYLGAKSLLKNTSKLAKRVNTLNKRIVKNGMNPSFWGPAKSIAMTAMDAGVDVTDEIEMNQFVATYNLYQAALNDAVDIDNKDEMDNFVFEQLVKTGAKLDSSVSPKHKKIGRNDPCPCGSGKKYKKCCLNEDKYKDKKIMDLGVATEKDIKDFFSMWWDEDKIKKMSTTEIIKKLKAMNVTFEPQTFNDQTRDYISAVELAEAQYYTQDCRFKNEDEDFIGLALIVLWERLCPGQYNIEMMDDAIKDGFRNINKNKYKEALKKWALVWKMMKHFIPLDIKSIEEAEEFFSGKMSQLILPWCEDYETELAHMGLKKSSYFKKRIEFCREFINRFPESDEDLMVNMHCAEAESYFASRDSETAERLFKELVEKYPGNPQEYLSWGDIYFSPLTKDGVILDLDRAEEIYKLGIKEAKLSTEMLYERLAELEELRDIDFD